VSLAEEMKNTKSTEARLAHETLRLDAGVAQPFVEVQLALDGAIEAADELEHGQRTADGDHANSYVGSAEGRTLFRGLDREVSEIVDGSLKRLGEIATIYSDGSLDE
jgi:hypothetical protein